MKTRTVKTCRNRLTFAPAPFFLLLAAAFFAFGGCGVRSSENGALLPKTAQTGKNDASKRPLRIVSTVPSVTETLFAVGLGDSVVAVSNYCQYPPEVARLPKIGSLFDFNVESVVAFSPDYVVLLKENDDLRRRLSNLGIETVAVDAASLDGVLESFETLGALGGDATFERGKAVRADAERRIAAIRESVVGLERPSVLISVDRTPGIGKISDVFVAAQNPYFNDVLEIVGATNAAGKLPGAVPTVGPEGIAALNPDVVVDLATDGVYSNQAIASAKIAERRADWRSLGNGVKAVKNDKIFPILDLFATVPGPRTVLFLEALVDRIHPERSQNADAASTLNETRQNRYTADR